MPSYFGKLTWLDYSDVKDANVSFVIIDILVV